MISVSDGFKKAIKSQNREIHGYVEVEYQHDEYSLSVSKIPQLASVVLSDGSGLFNNKKLTNDYATLENNFTLLDGSFMVWNENVQTSIGIITNDLFEDINDTEIIIENSTDDKLTKGITIYFRDNLPFDFDIDYIYSGNVVLTDNVRNNSSMTYQKIFLEEQYISEISITILNVEKPNNRLRITNVDFNLSDLYEGEQLISFDVTEEIDLLVENIPANTCTVSLNNYPDSEGRMKFDPINPVGLVSYLTENTTLVPYIGVLTEDKGIEYVPMGVFYLDDWSSNADGNVTLNGKNVINRIKNITISSDGTFLTNTFTGNSIATYFSNMTGYNFKFVNFTAIHNYFLRHNNLLEWLQARLPFYIMYYNSSLNRYISRKFYVTRQNVITLTNLNETSVDTINRNQLIDDLKYETKSVINKVEIKDISTYSMSGIRTENVVDDSHTLLEEEEYVWYVFNKFANYEYSGRTFSYNVISGSGTAQLVDINYYMAYIKFTGTIGSVIHVTYNTYVYDEPPTKLWAFTNDYKTGDMLSLDFHEYFDASDSALEGSANFYLTRDKKYKATANTIGDPSLEVGDTVSVQTRYEDNNGGYKDIVLTKQTFTFDGSLQCSIEGRGD